MKYTDLLLVDIKHIDTECHKVLTGRSNENILDMIRYLSDIKKPIWIRHVLVPKRSDKDEYLTRLADFIHSLNNVEKVEILPYHTMGIYKWKELGLDYPCLLYTSSHCKNKKSSHHTFSYHLCCCFDSRRFSLLHDELCCSKAMAVCRNVWFQNRPMCIRTCHRNEPHMDISRYGKKGLLFNSLGENRRKKK